MAAFIGEPIAGATLGAVVPPAGYWPRVRAICDRYGILLIVDEVMTGMGRTGRWLAIEDWGITPDVMCLGKGVSGGYLPLSVTAVRGDMVELYGRNRAISTAVTFSHQPSTAAAGVATLDYLEKHNLIAHAQQVGIAGNKLHEAFDTHLHVGDIRGRGLMWGLELGARKRRKQPFPPSMHLANRVFEQAFERGLIVYVMSGCADGVAGDHVMVSPPLVVTEGRDR